MPAKRKNKVKIKWSQEFAYALGIIATDGNLSPDLRHINITSKDKEILIKIKKIFNINNKIGRKSRGYSQEKKYFVLQFGDKNFYNFLNSIGLYKAKSKTLSALKIPSKYFIDFFLGCIDGDGCITISKHPESSLPQLRVRLCSASIDFINWVKSSIKKIIGINNGWIYTTKKKIYFLSYGKMDSTKLLKIMYHRDTSYYLTRKYQVARKFLGEW